MIRINRIDNILNLSARKIIEVEYRAGWTVRNYLDAHAIDLTDLRLVVSGKVENNLDRVLSDKDEILLLPRTEGPIIGGIIAIFKIISVIAAVAAIGYSVYQAITYKKPAPPSFGSSNPEGGGIGIDENSSPTYGWDGISTQQSVGACVPVVYGEHMVGGNIINSFISTDQDKNYFNVLLALCEGEIDGVSDIEINDNPVANFDGVTEYKRYGTNDQTVIPNFEDLNDINSVEATLTKNNAYDYQTSQEVDGFELYIRFPNGIYSQNREDGELIQWAVTYNVQYKKHTDGAYTDLGNTTVTTKSRTTVRRIYRKDGLAKDIYDIRVTKTSDDSSGYSVGDMILTSINEIQVDDLAYPNTALLGMKLLATDQLSGGVPNITSIIRGRKVYCPDLKWKIYAPSLIGTYDVDYDHYIWNKTDSRYEGLLIPSYRRRYYTRPDAVGASLSVNLSAGSSANNWDLFAYKATGLTLVFRIRPDYVSENVTLFYEGGPNHGSSGYRIWIGVSTSGKVFSQLNSYDVGTKQATGATTLSLTEDTVVVVTIADGTNTNKIYVNGVLDGQSDGHIDTIPSPRTNYQPYSFLTKGMYDPIHIGSGGWGYGYKGTMGEPSIYNRILTPTEISLITNDKDNIEPTTGLVGHLDLSDIDNGGKVIDTVTSERLQFYSTDTWDANTFFFRDGCYLDGSAMSPAKYSANPAWCLRDLILNTRFGLGEYITTSELDETRFLEAAKWCDEKVADGAGYYEKRMTFNVVIDSQTRAADLISQLASSFRGITFYSCGTVILKIDKEETPVQVFGMGNIIEGSFQQQWKSIKDMSNVIEVSYLDAEKNYQKQRVSVYDEASLAAGNPIRKRQIMIFTTRISQALREGRYVMLVNKYIDESISFKAGSDAIALQAGDVISVSHDLPQWGYSGRVQAGSTDEVVKLDQPVTLLNGFTYKIKVRHNATDTIEEMTITDAAGTYTQVNVCVGTTHLPKFVTAPAAYDVYAIGKENILTRDYRVISLDRTAQDEVQLTCIEYDEDIYDDSAVVLPTDNYSDLTKITPDVTDLAINEKLVVLSGGVLQNVIEVWFNKPSNAGVVINKYKSANIYLSQDAGTSWVLKGNTEGTYFAISDGIGDLQSYRVAVVSVSEEGHAKAIGDSPYKDITVAGKTSLPADVTNLAAVVEGDHIKFTWTQVTDVDLAGYEIRKVASMVEPWADGTVKATGITGGAYNLFEALTEGTHYYAIKAKDTSGNYSDAANYASVTVTAGDIARNNNAYALASAILNQLAACKLLLVWTTPTTTEVDQSGTGNNGTYQNVLAADHTVLGQVWGITLNGSTKYISVADSADFSCVAQAFAIGFTINVKDGAAQRDIFSKYDSASGAEDREYLATIGSDEKIVFRLYDESNNGYIQITSNAALSAGRHFIVVHSDGTVNASGLTMYDNGVAIADTDATSGTMTAMVAGATPVYIGASKNGAAIANPFDDQIGLVFFERASLTPSKIWQIFLACRGYLGL